MFSNIIIIIGLSLALFTLEFYANISQHNTVVCVSILFCYVNKFGLSLMI